jgi:hypothetical protein
MTVFTNRDLERVASLRMNWRREFLREVVRLRHERHIAKSRDHIQATEPPILVSQPGTGYEAPTLCRAPDLLIND